jgi:aspartyl-tRNA(Asn)/glutamyl-tRNA(Gln) amidotransferase subunit B
VNTLGLAQVSDEAAIAAAVDEVIQAQPKAVADFKRGKQIALDGLIGAVMGKMKGKANGQVVRRLLLERIA